VMIELSHGPVIYPGAHHIDTRNDRINFVFARVGIHRSNFEDFILDLRNCYSQSSLCIGFTQ
jgi:hypothetical protein